MNEEWWPSLLRFVPSERPWSEIKVPVARFRTIDTGDYHPGEYRSFTALVPTGDLDAVLANPARLDHEVSASGPRPWDGAAPDYDPSFWIGARELPKDRYEPLVLSWTSNNQTAFAPDPRFLMTYGLMPRTLSKGKMVYDDPATPTFDVVEVDPPSVWNFPVRTSAEVRISRDYLQDYLTLRGMTLFEVFYAVSTGEIDQDSLDALGGQVSKDFPFKDRLIQLIHSQRTDDNSITAQVWGARLIATPNDLPITNDPIGTKGLVWPGFTSPITPKDARRFGISDCVYVDDRVLAPYEGKPDFSINPESGSVTFGSQWGVGFCERVGRNTIRLELKKLYEGAPSSAIRHWNGHAVTPTAALLSPAARAARNVATRAKEIVLSWAAIGETLKDLADALGIEGAAAATFVKLEKAHLDYYGWWTPNTVEPVTRHIPFDMDRDVFLQRCLGLNNLLTESLGVAALKDLVGRLSVPEKEYKRWGGLKLLNEIVCLAQAGSAAGLLLSSDADLARHELKTNGTDPARPLEYLFALHDLRIVAAHTSGDPAQELENRLARFGIDRGEYAGGFGPALDLIYDELARELSAVAAVLASDRSRTGSGSSRR